MKNKEKNQQKIKLKIESQKKTTIMPNTVSYFADKIKYVKDTAYQRKILKEKLKDRYRIKGISFSNHSTGRNNNQIDNKFKRKKKGDSFNLLDKDEANFLLSIKYYDKLKHKINWREKNERIINEKLDKELLKRDINYTNLREAIYQFMRFKNKSNLYRAHILKNKLELKLASRKNRKNLINQTFKNVMSHFSKVKGRVDIGKKPLDETENEHAYKELVEQIAKSRVKYMNKIKNENETKVSLRRSLMILNSPNHFLNLLGIIIDKEDKNQNQQKFIKDKDYDKVNNIEENNENNNNKNYGKYCITEENDIKFNNNNCFRELNYKKTNPKRKISGKRKFHFSDKGLTINLHKINNNLIETDMKTQRLNHMNYDKNLVSQSNNNLSIYPESTNFNNNNNFSIITNNNPINNPINNNLDVSTKNIKTENDLTPNDKSNIDSSKNKQAKRYSINLEKMFKNNQIVKLKKRNSKYWNNNMRRVHTAGFRAISNKVANKPLYTTKIGDFVKGYNRIKTISKKAKKKMIEKPMTSMEDIDKIIKVKEDLLMFNLKMKFFNCSFPQKREKVISKKQIFRKKIKKCMDLLDNRLNGEYNIINDESSNNDD